MAIEEQINQIKAVDGPTVAGQRTTASIFSTDELRRTAFLPSLLRVINAAYYASESSQPELRMNLVDRLGSMEEFFRDLRDDGESFTAIVHHPDSADVIGTGSVRRYRGPPEGASSPWQRRLGVEANTVEWELKLMSTDPVAQGCGVATFLVRLLEEEIVRRQRQKSTSAPPGSMPSRVRMVLCTPAELYGSFYQRRGYQKDYDNPRGGEYNFHIIFMSKLLFEETGADAIPGVNGA